MTNPSHPTRRGVLTATSGAALLGLAGCLGAPGGAGSQQQLTTAEPTTTEAESGDHHDEPAHGDDDHHEEEEHHEAEETHAEGEGHGADGPVGHSEVAMESTDDGEHFHPHVAWVEVGGTVTFVNESGAHTATAYHPDNGKQLRMPEDAEPFDSGILTEAGATFEHTFEVEGVYDIYCAPHETLGMIGSVVVGRPDPHEQPGLAEPAAEMPERVREKLASLNEQVDTMLGHEH